MMSIVKFQNFWKENFPEVPPVMWILRAIFKENWVRFYSLPGGKQFPTCPEEFSTTLRRYNEISNSIFEENEIVWLLLAVSTNDDRSHLENDFIAIQKFTHIKQEKLTDEDGDVEFVEIYYKEIKWGNANIINIYSMIINESVPQILFVSKNKDMFAPYAGGSDILIQDISRLETLKLNFKDWISDREDGL